MTLEIIGDALEIKPLEIRDHATCIGVLAIKMKSADPIIHRYLSRYGFPGTTPGMEDNPPAIVMMRVDDQRASSDPYHWGDRTHQTAHVYIDECFDSLRPGQVVDVRVIANEALEPAAPEIWTG